MSNTQIAFICAAAGIVVVSAITGVLSDLLVVAAALVGLRLAVTWKVRRMMRLDSDEQSRWTSTKATPSSTVPDFIIADATTTDPAVIQAREVIVDRARSLFNRTLLRDLAASIIYFGIPFVLTEIVLLESGSVQDRETLQLSMWINWLVGLILFGLLLVRAIGYRNQFRAQDARFEGMGATHPALAFYRELARPENQILVLVFVVAISIDSEQSLLASVALGLAIGLHLSLVWLSMPKQSPNIKLLILRVFGVDENAAFTFGRLAGFWEHVGSYFTVVDKSFLQIHYRLRSWRTARLGIIVIVTSHFLNESLQDFALSHVGMALWSFLYTWGFIPAAIFVMVLVVAIEFQLINRSFVRSTEHLRSRLRHLDKWPRSPVSLAFRGMPTMCHNNTWRQTVSEFVEHADVVLMDLRGYSEQRKGVGWEVDYILDTLPLERMVFLVDSENDQSEVQGLILEQWKMLSKTSPNLEFNAPVAQFYIASQQDELDVQGIYDNLIGAVLAGGGLKNTML